MPAMPSFRPMVLSTVVLLTLAAGLNAEESPDAPQNWPGFLSGQLGIGTADSQVPRSWSPESVTWQATLTGYGQSSPIQWGDWLYVTTTSGPNKEQLHLICLDLATGEQRWIHTIESSDPVPVSYLVSRAAPTPVCDAAGVYAFFESGDVVAVDHAGQPLWNLSLSTLYGKFDNKFGLAASPVQTAEAIYILADHDGVGYLIALSKRDGEVLWKTDRAGRRSWSSPALVQVEGQPQIVCSSVGSLEGYDPADGKMLWNYDQIGGNSAATPIDAGDARFLTGALVRPSDGPSEFALESNLLARIVREGDQWQVKIEWIAEKARGSFSSPILSERFAYWVNSSGVAYCLEAETGEQHFGNRLPCGPCWATPLVVGEDVFFFGKDGETSVLRRGTDFKVVAESNRLWDPENPPQQQMEVQQETDGARQQAASRNSGPVQYAAIVVGDSLIVRTGSVVYCVRPVDE